MLQKWLTAWNDHVVRISLIVIAVLLAGIVVLLTIAITIRVGRPQLHSMERIGSRVLRTWRDGTVEILSENLSDGNCSWRMLAPPGPMGKSKRKWEE